MFGIPGHDAVRTGAHGAFNKDGILIITVLIAERVLAVDAERINQTEDGQQFPDYLPCFDIDVFFSFELFSGEEMNIRDLLRSKAAFNLFIGNRTENNGSVLKPGLTPL